MIAWLVAVMLQAPALAAEPAPAHAEPEPKPHSGSTGSPPATTEDVRRDNIHLEPVFEFLPRSYIYLGSKVGPPGRVSTLIFGAEPALHLPLFNNLRTAAARGIPWGLAFTFSYGGALRMIADDQYETVPGHSDPVRMPSHPAQLEAQAFWMPRWQGTTDGFRPRMLGGMVTVGHYSNGQEGCTFDGALYDGTPECDAANRAAISDPAADLALLLNRRSGNFSTNRFMLSLLAKLGSTHDQGRLHHVLNLAGTWEREVGIGPGGIDENTRRIYGTNQVRVAAEYEYWLDAPPCFSWLDGAARGRIDLWKILAADPRVPDFAFSVTGSYAFARLHGLGLFLRYWHGRDFYNAFFVDNLSQLQFGAQWDMSSPLIFREPPFKEQQP